MKNKKKLLLIIMIVMLILSFILIALLITHNNNRKSFMDDEPFAISDINNIDDKEYKVADSLKIDNEVFPVLLSDYKPINKSNGYDENGNKYTILNYNPDEISEMDLYDFADIMINYANYFEFENDNDNNETVLIARAKDPENILVISMYHNEEKAYIKYTICKASSMDLTKLGDYYEIFMSEEL